MINNNESCFINLEYNNINFETFSLYYIIINSPLNKSFIKFTLYFLIIGFLNITIFFLIILWKIDYLEELSCFAFSNFSFLVFFPFSCIFIQFFILPNVFFYSIYKSYMIINIILYLNGYKILYFQNNRFKKWRYIIFLSIIELIISFIFLQIIYFYPSFDNFYLFFVKNIIEHIIILVVLIKVFLNNFLNLYRQYRLERRMRQILTITYKYKLLIYSKFLIFTLLYCLGFITMNLIQIFYRINYYVDGFCYTYYMNLGLDLFFCIILITIFYPTRNSKIYNLPIIINNNNLIFFGKIKKRKENEMKFGKLNKNILKQKYLKNEYPLILVEPFAKTDKIFNNNNTHIHIGLTKID